MPWRFLVDEDTDIGCVAELIDRGFDAVSVRTALGKGTPDPAVAAYANRESRILITADRDFLDPDLRDGIRVFMVADATARGDAIAERIMELVGLARGPADLQPVTWI